MSDTPEPRHPRLAPRIAIIGAGPAGLEAALAAAERGWSFRLYEAGDRPAANVRSWGHVRLFSPWSMNVSERARQALEAVGREVPDGDACPTGDELADALLDPLAELPQVAPHLALGTKVEKVGRRGLLKHQEISSPERAGRPFRLLVADGDGSAGGERIEEADAVVDTSGAFTHPNSLGDGGIPAPGERSAEGAIHRRLPDLSAAPDDWAGRTTLLVGAGHSAQTAARDLARLAAEHDGTRVVWSFRGAEPSWVIEDDVLPERAELTARAEEIARGGSDAFQVHPGTTIDAIESRGEALHVTLRSLADGVTETVQVDRILALTGATGDHHLYRELQVHECYASGAPMKLAAALLSAAGGGGDCTTQTGHGPQTLLNPEPRFFILGAKSYGRSGNYLMRLGSEQVEDAFSLLDESFGG
jgi:thioredoxin reductase